MLQRVKDVMAGKEIDFTFRCQHFRDIECLLQEIHFHEVLWCEAGGGRSKPNLLQLQ
jgi:hypothetical protein